MQQKITKLDLRPICKCIKVAQQTTIAREGEREKEHKNTGRFVAAVVIITINNIVGIIKIIEP